MKSAQPSSFVSCVRFSDYVGSRQTLSIVWGYKIIVIILYNCDYGSLMYVSMWSVTLNCMESVRMTWGWQNACCLKHVCGQSEISHSHEWHCRQIRAAGVLQYCAVNWKKNHLLLGPRCGMPKVKTGVAVRPSDKAGRNSASSQCRARPYILVAVGACYGYSTLGNNQIYIEQTDKFLPSCILWSLHLPE